MAGKHTTVWYPCSFVSIRGSTELFTVLLLRVRPALREGAAIHLRSYLTNAQVTTKGHEFTRRAEATGAPHSCTVHPWVLDCRSATRRFGIRVHSCPFVVKLNCSAPHVTPAVNQRCESAGDTLFFEHGAEVVAVDQHADRARVERRLAAVLHPLIQHLRGLVAMLPRGQER